MRMKRMRATLTTIVIAATGGAMALAQANPAPAQVNQANKEAQVLSQTDVALSGYEAFTSSTSGNGTTQTPSNSAGGMLEVRHIMKPLLGLEFTYSFNPANQAYTPTVGSCGYFCSSQPIKASASASEISLDYVASKKFGNLRPFVVGGLGFFITVGAGSETNNLNTVVRIAYVYGGGTDWAFSQHLGIRIQYRGNLYKAPNVSPYFLPTGVYTQSGEPMGGVYYSF